MLNIEINIEVLQGYLQIFKRFISKVFSVSSS